MATFLKKRGSLYLLPAVLFLFLLLLFSFFRFYLIQREESRRLALATVVASQVASTLEVFSADRKRALNDLIISWPNRHPNPVDWFHTHASSMKNVLPGIEDVWWVNPDFSIRWSLSADERELLLNKPLTYFGFDEQELSQKGSATSLYEQGKLVDLYALRVDPNNPQLGFVVASFDIKTSLSVMIGDLIGPQFNFSIYDANTLLLAHGELSDDGSIVNQAVSFAERNWLLKLQSSQQTLQIGTLIFWGGSLMSALICQFLFWQFKSALKLSKSQMHYQAASEAALDSIMVYEALRNKQGEVVDFRLVDGNKVAAQLFAFELHRQRFQRLSQHLQRMGGAHILKDLIQVNQDGRPFECTLSIQTEQNRQWLKLQVVKASNGVAMTVRDITVRHLAQQKLQASEAKFRRLMDGLHGHFIYSIDAVGDVTFISHSVKDILGYDADDFRLNFKQYTMQMPANMGQIRKRQLRGLRTESYLVSYLSVQQKEVIIEYTDSPVFDEHEALVAIEGIGRDVTVDIKLKEKIYHQANHDQLTGLLNRYAFDRKLKDTLKQFSSSKNVATLCYIDMDQFKLVNDTCGHQAGDLLLQNIANILGQTLGERDLLARVGGDEFCMILADTNSQQAEQKVQAILDNVAAFRFLWEDNVFHVGASIGLVQIDSQYTDAVSLIKAADNACYTAKNNGRNQYQVHNQNAGDLDFRNTELDILAQLQYALEHNKFELYFQTIKPLSRPHHRHSYEILLRMTNEQGEMLSPAMFIPIAERHGLMSRVDHWVFEHTLRLLEQHPEHVAKLEKCSINLSGASLNSPSVLAAIVNRLKLCSVPAKKICFEITETTAVMNLVNANKMINQIRDLGCQFALDDFGAGMSSFTYLKNMHVDVVKIDGSFVRNMCNEASDMATVKAIHDIAKSMGKQTVAEFVGNKQTEASLKAMGIDYAQGFAIAKPLPFAVWLNSSVKHINVG